MNNSLAITLIVAGISYGTPLLLAGLGEVLVERSGVLNLGIEGMMLVGAAVAFWTIQSTAGPAWLVLLLGLLAGAAAGTLLALIFAFVCITMRANQVVAGLALTIFGGATGLSTYLAYAGNLTQSAGRQHFNNLNVLGLGHIPVVGPILFDQDAIVYLSWLLVIAAWFYLYRTRIGMNLRAVGEDPHAADSMGVNVSAYRYVHILIGGALAGAAGAYYSLALTPSWSNGLTAGAGWIALGLVILAFWRPGLLVIGAYLFGIVTSTGFTLQARGVKVPPELFAAVPYVAVVVVLALSSSIWRGQRLEAPSALTEYYQREEA